MSVDVRPVCIFTSTCFLYWGFAFDVSKSFPYGYGAHNVCFSTTPVFNFLTWKAFPSKETEKTVLYILTQGVWSSLYVTFLPFTSSPLCPSTFPTAPFTLVCFVICGSCGSLFYMRWLLRLAFTLLWPVREQLTNSSVYSCCRWLSHTVSPFVGLFLFKFFFCQVAASVWASCCSSSSSVFVLPQYPVPLGQTGLW